MREIKFRAWNFTDNKMLYNIESIEFYSEGATNVYCQDGANLFVRKKGFIQFPSCRLMQFIGLKDCEGKEIYEGDICVRHKVPNMDTVKNHNPLFEIRFGKRGPQFYGYVDGFLNDVHLYDFSVDFSYKVVGNIYENPDLVVVASEADA